MLLALRRHEWWAVGFAVRVECLLSREVKMRAHTCTDVANVHCRASWSVSGVAVALVVWGASGESAMSSVRGCTIYTFARYFYLELDSTLTLFHKAVFALLL